MSIDRREHWEKIHRSKDERTLSWFQEVPVPSLELIARFSAIATSAIIDIGGGGSRLIDALVDSKFQNLTVLDLSETALNTSKVRLGGKARRVHWICADVTSWEPQETYDLWHDRAAFHFLTEDRDCAAYVSSMTTHVRPGGHAIIGTFASDGPERCSGLPVVRYDPQHLGELIGSAFARIESRVHIHTTPWGSRQSFQFSVLRRV